MTESTAGDSEEKGGSEETGTTTPAETGSAEKEESKQNTNEKPEKHWGSYYDPKDVFCGKYDCYKILGFDFESFGRSPPDSRDITKSYRTLSRRWHPDKNKGRGAKERFVKINKAYEVLTNSKRRAEYDHLRERPDEYFMKYGSTVLFHYAPKSDVRFILFLFLSLGSAFTWFVQMQRWQTVADRVVKAALEGLGAREGGSTESLEVRQKAEQILAKRRQEEAASKNGSSNGNAATPKKEKKLTNKERKLKEQDELRPIIVQLVKEMKDFGGGFHQPTWKDLLVVKLVQWPIFFAQATIWQMKFWYRRLRKEEYSDEEREVLTRRAIGDIAWNAATDQERESMKISDVWISQKYEDWKEEQSVKQLSTAHKKKHDRWKKKQG